MFDKFRLVPFLFVLVLIFCPGLASASEEPSEGVFPYEMPVFKALDEQGVAVPSSRFKNQVLLLDFWASWCRPCLFTLPELQRLHETYGERDDFAVVGLAIDEGRGGGVRARKFAKKAGVTYANYHDESSKPASPQFKIEAVPVLFLVSAEGKILHRWDGEPDFSEVEAMLKAELGIEEEPAKSEDG